MPASMKNLFDHLDSLLLNVSSMEEMFEKRAFIITTGSGSVNSLKTIKSFLKHSDINRVFSFDIRMLTDQWAKMPKSKQVRYEKSLHRSAQRFYKFRKSVHIFPLLF